MVPSYRRRRTRQLRARARCALFDERYRRTNFIDGMVAPVLRVVRHRRQRSRLHAVAAHDALQVIDLVLEDARVPAGRDLDDALAVLVERFDADLASARRVAKFVEQHPITYVLGGHIELDESGKTFFGTRYHPNERPLQLTKQDLLALPGIVEGFNGIYARRGVYVLMNQNRILILLGIGAVILLVAIILPLRALWRRLRPRTVAN